ncbi:hypothetical protein NHQ30_008425 [Ciborinia camelliae]|nr:hypothetical protein NHQ30_008425 [Ciborinia camelliae]
MVSSLPEVSLSDEMGELRNGMLWLKIGSEGFESSCAHLRWRIVWFREIGAEGEKFRGLEEIDGRGEYEEGDVEIEGDTVATLEKTHGSIIRFAGAEEEDFKLVVMHTLFKLAYCIGEVSKVQWFTT